MYCSCQRKRETWVVGQFEFTHYRDLRNSGRFVFGCGTSGAAFLSDPVVMFILVLQTGMGSSH
jgi:hypothetical protein